MKYINIFISYFLSVIVMLSFLILQPANAADLDDVYYSAAMCKPTRATSSQGQTDLRFQYQDAINADSGDIKGGWYNYDNSNKETLICPIPHNRSGSGKVNVNAVVNDRSNSSSGLSGTIGVQLCAQAAHGATVCPPLGEANDGSGNSFIGTKTIKVSISPSVTGNGPNTARWFWLNITLPSIDSQTGASGFLGYRVTRN